MVSVTINKSKRNEKVGISFVRNSPDGVSIASIARGSLASESDLKEGQLITSINGQSTESMSVKDAVSIVRDAESIVITTQKTNEEAKENRSGVQNNDSDKIKRTWPGSDLGKYFCATAKVEIRRDAQYVRNQVPLNSLYLILWLFTIYLNLLIEFCNSFIFRLKIFSSITSLIALNGTRISWTLVIKI
jgi:hypothetical protein